MVSLRSGKLLDNKEMQNGTSAHKMDKKFKYGTAGGIFGNMHVITFFSLVMDLLGFTVILPLFPALLEYYSENDSSGLYDLVQKRVTGYGNFFNVPSDFNSVLFGGFLGSLFSLLQFISSPVTGAMSDVYGRKPVFIFSFIGISISYLIWAVSSNFLLFVIFRIVGGLCKGNVSLSYSVMTDLSDAQSRSKGMALVGVAFSIGFTIGPVVGVGFSKWGTTGWFAASAIYAFCLSVMNLIFFQIFFVETLPETKRVKSIGSGFRNALNYISPPRLFSFTAVDLPKRERSNLKWLGVIYFFYLFIYSGLEFTLTFVTHHKHGFNSMDQGKMFSFLGIVMALVQGGYVRRIKSGKEKSMAMLGLLMMVPSFIIIGMAESMKVLYFGLFLYSIGSSLMVPCLTSLASMMGPPSQKGAILGIWRSLGALARASGPLAASVGFWSLGTAFSYSLGGVLLVVPLIMLKMYDATYIPKRV